MTSTRIWFSVSVPVLSMHATVTPPSVSAVASRRTMMPRIAHVGHRANQAAVAVTGRPSGIAATPSATDSRRISSGLRSHASDASPASPAAASPVHASRDDNALRRRCSPALGRARRSGEPLHRRDLGSSAGRDHDRAAVPGAIDVPR